MPDSKTARSALSYLLGLSLFNDKLFLELTSPRAVASRVFSIVVAQEYDKLKNRIEVNLVSPFKVYNCIIIIFLISLSQVLQFCVPTYLSDEVVEGIFLKCSTTAPLSLFWLNKPHSGSGKVTLLIMKMFWTMFIALWSP